MSTPTRIGRYQISSLLGRGGMGSAVYLAYDPKIGRQVALKLPGHVLAEGRERFLQRARRAGELRHPHIVSVLEAGEADDRLYIAMEYIAGESLRDIVWRQVPIRLESIPLESKLSMIGDVCSGLQYMHRQDLVHGHIKPSNLMVRRDGPSVAILDAERASKAPAAWPEPGALAGHPSYISPEQILGGQIDRRSDVFNVGVVLYELLADQSAFKGGDGAAVLWQIVHGRTEPVATADPDLDSRLNAILDRALAKDPEERYQDIGQFEEDLKRIRVAPRMAG